MNIGLIGYQDAAEIIGVPIGTLYAWVSENKIPHKRLGKRLVRFSTDEIKAWISKHSVEQKNEVKPHRPKKRST